MTSQLFKQLKQIADEAPHFKSRPSLVLDYDQAKDSDRHSIFAIGQNGLQELILLDANFEKFENNLFSEVLIDGDVTLMNPEERIHLNRTIKDFLLVLSPHFSHHSAFKALEWLIRRYRIHEYNVDELIECMLPFHESPQFVHVIRILIFTDKTRYGFVEASKKSNVPLERSTLVVACKSNLSILRLICKLFLETIELRIFNRYICSFFVCTITDYLSSKQKPNEDAIRILFACLLRATALSAPQPNGEEVLPMNFSATIAILFGQLSHWLFMSKQVFSQVEKSLLCILNEETVMMIVLSMIQIFQSQPEIPEFSAHFVDQMIQFPEFQSKIELIATKYDSRSFLKSLASALSRNATQNAWFSSLLNTILIKKLLKEEETLKKITISLIETNNLSIDLSSNEVLRTMMNLYGSTVNQVLQEEMKSSKVDVLNAISTAFKGTIYSPVEEESLTTFSALLHPEENVRLLAIHKLQEMINEKITKREIELDGDMTELIHRALEDSSEKVKMATLKMKHLEKVLNSELYAEWLLDMIENVECSLLLKMTAFIPLFRLFSSDKITIPKWTSRFEQCVLRFFAISEPELDLNLFVISESKKLKRFAAISQAIQENLPLQTKDTSRLTFATHLYEKSVSCMSKESALLPLIYSLANGHAREKTYALLVLNAANEPSFAKECRHFIHCFNSKEASLKMIDPAHLISELVSASSMTVNLEWNVLVSCTTHLFNTKDLNEVKEWVNVLAFKNNLAGCGSLLTLLCQKHLKSNLISFILENYLIQSCPTQLTWFALHVLHTFLKGTKTFKVDMQVLLAVLLTQLMKEKPIRSLAMDCISQLQIYQENVFKKPSPILLETQLKVPSLGQNAFSILIRQIVEFKMLVVTDASQIQFFWSEFLLPEPRQSKLSEVKTLVLSHLLAFIDLTNRNGLYELQLDFVSMLQKVDYPSRMSGLLPMMESQLQKAETKPESMCVDEKHVLEQLMKPLANFSLSKGSDRLRKQVISIMRRLLLLPSTFSALKTELLHNFSVDFFNLLGVNKKREDVFAMLLDVLLQGEDVSVCQQARESILHMNKPDSLYISCIESSLDEYGPEKHENEAKKQKGEELKDSCQLEKLTLVLELMSVSMSNLTDMGELADVLMKVVTCMYLNPALLSSASVRVEYMMQLTISNLLDLVKQAKNEDLATTFTSLIEENSIRVDVIVQSIRTTQNAQSRNLMLMLLAELAGLHPQVVLVNILPIFTFMGASILRQEDGFTFHVIQQTMQTIIPALVQSGVQSESHCITPEDDTMQINEVTKDKSQMKVVVTIVKMFVDAITHVPKHRRLRLFTLLVSTLGETMHLSTVVMHLLIKSVEMKNSAAKSEYVDTGFFQFMKAVCDHFPMEVRMSCVVSVLKSLYDIPIVADQKTTEDLEVDLTGLTSAVQWVHLRTDSLQFMSLMMDGMLDEAVRNKQWDKSALLPMVEICLKMMQDSKSISPLSLSTAVAQATQTLLTSVTSLMDRREFILLILDLIAKDDEMLQLSSLQLLNDKILALTSIDKKNDDAVFHSVADSLFAFLKKNKPPTSTQKNANHLTHLILAVLTRRFAAQNQEKYILFVPLVCDLAQKEMSTPILALISALVGQLGPRMLPFLSKVILQLIASCDCILEKSSMERDAALFMALMGALSVMVDTLPNFMSPYISSILRVLAHKDVLSCKKMKKPAMAKVYEKVAALDAVLAKKIPIRVLFPRLVDTYKMFMASLSANAIESASANSSVGLLSVVALFEFLQKVMSDLPKSDLIEHYKTMNSFFISCFDFGAKIILKADDVMDLFSVEKTIIAAYVQMCMKLNENMFKPCFMKVFDWLKSGEQLSSTLVKQRKHFFYTLVDTFFDRLKIIFVPYSGYFVDDLISFLSETSQNGLSEEDLPQWKLNLTVIYKMVLYDHDDAFGNQQKSMKMMKSLVEQMAIETSMREAYVSLMESHVIPALAQMAVNVRQEDLWKALNYEVCMKTRYASSKMRFVALKMIMELYTRVGEEFLALLPETIPFLAELMEDEDVKVEKLCHQTCLAIEQILGEDIQQYFNA